MSATSGQRAGRSVTADVDLDALAAGYRHRPPTAAALARPMRAGRVAGLTRGDLAIDVGGGPGEHAATWVAAGATAVVVDPTDAMVRRARAQHGVAAIRARAESLPLAGGCARLVYLHNALHYLDWRAASREWRRVLAPGGMLWIWTLGPDHHPSSYLARWFPSVAKIDAARFPDPGLVAAELHDRGFADLSVAGERERVRRSAGEWLAAVRAGFISTIQLLEPEELHAGLAAFQRQYPNPDEVIDYTIRFTVVSATRTSLP